jgi:hypothetical protein
LTEYRLLKEFRGLFDGTKYEHRRSNLGDFVAITALSGQRIKME